ncbi:PRTRC system protein E [Paraburkholderia sp. SIMBA_050]|uniref:PRTRC system protein E n=1 Tax=Paraburkholderia terricola TaxID=169427 RepID=A0A1M6YPA7_9BURK|nr:MULTISPECIES: PRTRC system protein E [Paraburkholderia]SDP41179.1 PRTRC system protein E [Paraburkholderia sediminicola]SHL19935.1 PRTRC system protein E [Paraburkholderia terricola]
MSLFASLYPLAQKTTLTLLITAEGDQLRVNVTPRAKDDVKGEKTLYPLSILATPDELDRDFAEAVAIYEPSTQSVLDQARAASEANGTGKSAPAPAATKGKPGRKVRSGSGDAADSNQPPVATDRVEQEALPVDPRQTAIPGLDSEAAAAGDTPPAPADAVAVAAAPDADGVDIF